MLNLLRIQINLMIFLLSSLVISICLAQQPIQEESQAWVEVYADVKSRVPLIFSDGRVCSGVLIDSDRVLTASHCVASLRPIFVFWEETFSMIYPAQVVALDGKNDLALLTVSTPSEINPISMIPESERLFVGEDVATIGHPTTGRNWNYPPFDPESTFLFSKGVISRVGADVVMSDLSISPGNSGGPAFNNRGQVVGIVSKKRIDRGVGSIAHLVGPAPIRSFLAKSYNQREPLSWRRADSNLSLNFWFNNDTSSGQNQSAEVLQNYELELMLALHDRIVLAGSSWLAGDLFRGTNYFAGWKFKIATSTLSEWTLIPGATHWLGKDNQKIFAPTVVIEQTVIPISFRFLQTTTNGDRDTVISLGLSLF